MKLQRIATVVSLLFLILPAFTLCQAPDTLWTKTFGGAEYDFGRKVLNTTDGGYLVLGYSASFSPPYYDIWLIKVNSVGDTLWTKLYGGPSFEEGFDIDHSHNGGYIIVGSTLSYGAGGWDVYVVMTDGNGDTLWTRTYGGFDWDRGHSVIQTSDSCYIITGYTESFGHGDRDLYIIKINSSGDTLWTRAYGGDRDDEGFHVIETSDSCYLAVGYTLTYFHRNSDVYLVKADKNGNAIFKCSYGGSFFDYGYSVLETIDRFRYMIVGSTNSFGSGNNDVLLLNIFFYNGSQIWAKTYGDSLNDEGYSILQTADTNFVLAGNTASYGNGNEDVFLLRVSSAGTIIWTKTFGGPGDDLAYDIQRINDGGYVIVGNTESFGMGNHDIWLLRTEPDPSFVEDEPHGDKTKGISPVLQIAPNPFNNNTVFQVLNQSSRGVKGKLQIFNVAGRLMREFTLSQDLNSTICWDGRDNCENIVPPSIYFIKINGESAGKAVKIQ